MTVTIQQIRDLKTAERLAQDAFWAAAGKPGTKMTAKQVKLQSNLTQVTLARQAAMTAFAAQSFR